MVHFEESLSAENRGKTKRVWKKAFKRRKKAGPERGGGGVSALEVCSN